ncbi:MAG: response regulator [Candidatus Xenobiia bacterium LiM19]
MSVPAGKRILFIDDDVFLEKIVRFNLKDEGYIFTASPNGEDAVKILESNAQDLIILDLIMPRMDGWKFLDWLNNSINLCNIPVLVLTASRTGKEEIALKYQRCTIVDVLEKPFDLRDLVALITRIFSEHP